MWHQTPEENTQNVDTDCHVNQKSYINMLHWMCYNWKYSIMREPYNLEPYYSSVTVCVPYKVRNADLVIGPISVLSIHLEFLL
jgi:hypothetical protein